jgi:hypothetical protein
MTIQATIWAMALRDVSPVAKLAAIYISDNFDETTGRASRPLSLAKTVLDRGRLRHRPHLAVQRHPASARAPVHAR